ncbi:helix-turn-helix transcriptional regulator [Jatrophihabitans sp.]|uniref:helix-turn-helix transcriptional regulator n=1 Tax=Jatrophihabitans sp. TaxID=1932789 RepID=UPI0038CD2377
MVWFGVEVQEWKRNFGMHAFRRLIQARMDERGYKPADVVRLSGLSRQTLHSILTDSRDTIKEMPSRKTVYVLAEALRMPADQLLIAAAEAYGVPVAAPVMVPTVTDVSDAELARELLRRAVAREENGGAVPPPLQLSNIDGESVLAVVDLRRRLLAEAAAEADDRPGLAETLDHLARVITAALAQAAKAAD